MDSTCELAFGAHQPVNRRVAIAGDREAVPILVQRDLRTNRSLHQPRRDEHAGWKEGDPVLDAAFERDQDTALALADTREPHREPPQRDAEWLLQSWPTPIEPDSSWLNEAKRPAPELSLDLRNGNDSCRFERPIELPVDIRRRGDRR